MNNLNEIIELGVVNTLRVDRSSDHGLYLEAKDEESVLLPNAYVSDDMNIDDLIDVFIYTDSMDRLVATTMRPYAMKNEFVFAEVVDVLEYGAFVDWGLIKDLFVPRYMQKIPFKLGDMRILRIVEDEETQRLIGVEKIKTFLKEIPKGLKRNTKVNLLIFAKTPLGFKAIINNDYEGMIFSNEIFQDISIGDLLKGYIKQTTWEKKLDITLQPLGGDKSVNLNTEKILNILQKDSSIQVNYKSEPNEIKKIFSMSKKAFKKALTSLISDNKIILDTYIHLP
jgi:predicted RNA-binding protein (virulence factor B family)